VPQTLPVSQLELELLPNERLLTPESLEAKLEIFLLTFWLWQSGQMASAARLE